MLHLAEVKEIINETEDILNTLIEKFGLHKDTTKAVKEGLGQFMMYLSASDGNIKKEEADIISKLCDLTLSPSEINDYMKAHQIYSEEFEQTVPSFFQALVDADNRLYDAGIHVSASEIVLSAYKTCGGALAQADGDIDEAEASDYEFYIEMLEDYRNDTFLGAKKA